MTSEQVFIMERRARRAEARAARAVYDLQQLGDCQVCKHNNTEPAGCDCECVGCQLECTCRGCRDGSLWEWAHEDKK